MSVLKITGLGKSYGIETIFKDVSFEIRSGERIGLVGANGAGKTTLLKCIMNTEEPDTGSVKVTDSSVIGYLRQDFDYTSSTLRQEMEEAWKDVLYCKDKMENLARELEKNKDDQELIKAYGKAQTRFEFLGGYDYEAETMKILTGLGFTKEDLDRDIFSFSGGQKVRINLAAAFVRHPDFLLLDEPTNHLDMEMLEWLEEFLCSYKGGILMISHDRFFLDRAATGIIELEHKKIRTFRGGYTRYLKTKKEQDAAYEKAYEKQQEHIKETEAYIRKYKAGIKSKQARGRQSQLDRLVRLEKPKYLKTLDFHFKKVDDSGEKVLDMTDVKAAYGEKTIFENLEIHIRKGERVGLIGANGVGKTTLLKLITKEEKQKHGIIRLGSNVKVGYYSQEQDELNPQSTVLNQVRDMFDYGEEKARNILGMFLFKGDDVFKEISLLSGGEKARLSLLCLFLKNPNFLVLDEPTNHLDIPTREIMEDALEAFGGTSIIVSHDRYFLDKVTTRILEMEKGRVTEYLGNYTYYKEKKKDLLAFNADRNGKPVEAKEKKSEVAHKSKDVKIEKQTAPAKGDLIKLEKTEMEINRLEATMKMYDMQLGSGMTNYEEIAEQYTDIKNKLQKLYAKWEELAEEAGN